MKKHFDKNEFSYAMSTIHTNPWLSAERFETYLERYPNDYGAYPYYITSLTTIGEFEKAEQILNDVLSMISRDINYLQEEKFREHFQKDIFFCQIKLLAYQGRHRELYNLYMSNQDILFENSEYILVYCKKQLGLLTTSDFPKNSYIFKQIYEYSEELFRDHVKKHMYEHNIDLENKNSNIFSDDFPIDKILDEIKKHIPSDKRIFPGYYEDVYYFRYDNCGKVNNKTVNFFKVTCFHDTSDIITIVPVEDDYGIVFKDISYIYNDDGDKIIRKSQIDKFNQRLSKRNNK